MQYLAAVRSQVSYFLRLIYYAIITIDELTEVLRSLV
nr:MAG TPA: hypothetical protein [Caudoviricetes sp.]